MFRDHRTVFRAPWPVMLLRAIVAFTMLCATANAAGELIFSNLAVTPIAITFANVIAYVLTGAQIVVGIVFVIMAGRFYKTRKQVAAARPEAAHALIQLALVALIAFFGYVLVAISNIPSLARKLEETPTGLAGLQMMKLVSVSIRGLAVLWVLGVRVPKREPPSPSKQAKGR